MPGTWSLLDKSLAGRIDMRALVTGGAGFIGSHLVEQLLAEPDVLLVRVVDDYVTGKRGNIEPFVEQIDLIEGDLVDDGVREQAVRDIDVVFHQAAIPSVPRSIDDPVGAHRNGVHATLLLLDSARRANVKRFVFAGSSSAYGDTPRLPKQEAMLPSPLSPYAATKAACELYLRAFAQCYSIDTVSLRYFNVFGPRQDPGSPYSGVIARYCLAFCRGDRLTIFGDGEQSRDFTYVANVVQANLLAARHPQPLRGEVFNVGAGQRTTLNELLALFNRITGQDRRAEHLPARSGDVRHSLADIRKACEVLGYQPAVSVEAGLVQTMAWYRDVLAGRPQLQGTNA